MSDFYFSSNLICQKKTGESRLLIINKNVCLVVSVADAKQFNK
jgi:hypothetical protein